MPLFMPGGQRFALLRPKAPRSGLGYLRDLSALCGSFLFFLTSIRPENLSGLMTLCIYKEPSLLSDIPHDACP